jgi:hypothetical protein
LRILDFGFITWNNFRIIFLFLIQTNFRITTKTIRPKNPLRLQPATDAPLLCQLDHRGFLIAAAIHYSVTARMEPAA